MLGFLVSSLMSSSEKSTHAFEQNGLFRRSHFQSAPTHFSASKYSMLAMPRSSSPFIPSYRPPSSLNVSRSNHEINKSKINASGDGEITDNEVHHSFWLGKDNSKRRRATKHFMGTVSSLTSLKMKKNTNDNYGSKEIEKSQESANGFSPLTKIAVLEQENEILRRTVSSLENENAQLLTKAETAKRVVIEQFEGEGKKVFDLNGEELEPWWDDDSSDDEDEVMQLRNGVAVSIAENEACDEYEEDACPVEPDISFKEALQTRAKWLIGLLAMQSMSGFILARNEELLKAYPVIVYFLTMLVGAGGNAGNQASVRVIRGLALGTLNENTQKQFLSREFKMAGALSLLLSIAGFIRCAIFRTPFAETFAITCALALIVFSSILLGAILPLILKKLDVDPAHSSTSIQVVMDILGVVLTVLVSTAILDGPLGQKLMTLVSR